MVENVAPEELPTEQATRAGGWQRRRYIIPAEATANILCGIDVACVRRTRSAPGTVATHAASAEGGNVDMRLGLVSIAAQHRAADPWLPSPPVTNLRLAGPVLLWRDADAAAARSSDCPSDLVGALQGSARACAMVCWDPPAQPEGRPPHGLSGTQVQASEQEHSPLHGTAASYNPVHHYDVFVDGEFVSRTYAPCWECRMPLLGRVVCVAVRAVTAAGACEAAGESSSIRVNFSLDD